MQLTLLAWLVLERTDSPWLVSLVGFFGWMPMLILGLFGGLLADSVNRRALLIGTQAIVFATTLIMTAILLTGYIEYWHAYIAVSVTGISWALDSPARRSVIYDLVGTDGVTNAIALDSVGQSGSRMVGPALAGVLITLFDVQGGYVAMSLFAIISLSLLMRARVPTGHKNQFVPGRVISNLKEGLDYARKREVILAMVLITFFMNLLLFPYMQMVPVIARDVLGVGPTLMGILQAASGFGSLVGALFIASSSGLRYHGRYFIGGSALGLLALLVFSVSRWYGLSLPVTILLGLGTAGFGTMQSTIIILVAREDMRGRSLGVISLAIGASPLGALMIGGLASSFGAANAIGIHAILGMLSLGLVTVLIPALWKRPTSEARDSGDVLEPAGSPQSGG